MEDLVIAVPIPLALCSLVLVIGIFGLGRASTMTLYAKKFWLLFLGLEITLAFVSYFGLLWLPVEFLYFSTLLFCVASIGMLVLGLLAIVFEKRPT